MKTKQKNRQIRRIFIMCNLNGDWEIIITRGAMGKKQRKERQQYT